LDKRQKKGVYTEGSAKDKYAYLSNTVAFDVVILCICLLIFLYSFAPNFLIKNATT
jgi:hypothetical protein